MPFPGKALVCAQRPALYRTSSKCFPRAHSVYRAGAIAFWFCPLVSHLALMLGWVPDAVDVCVNWALPLLDLAPLRAQLFCESSWLDYEMPASLPCPLWNVRHTTTADHRGRALCAVTRRVSPTQQRWLGCRMVPKPSCLWAPRGAQVLPRFLWFKQ